MLKLVFVCSGNLCRSPMAAVIAERKLGQARIEAMVTSAGTLGIQGARPPQEALDAVAEVGLSLAAHRSQGISALLLKAATHVVVMARAHAETIKCVVKAGRDFGVKVMGDNMVCDDKAAASKWMEDLGVDYIVHHTGFDERNGIFADTGHMLSPLDDLKAVVEAVSIPVQAVGGLSIEQAVSMPKHGAPLVVIGAPLAIDAHSFSTAGGDLKSVLSEIVRRIRQ